MSDSKHQNVATHWGRYVTTCLDGDLQLKGHPQDPNPSPIGLSMLAAQSDETRILRPAVRASFLRQGYRAGGEGRGREPFIEVEWEEAEELVARELARVRERHGNEAIYGGSYGWGSAGRFHHAQSQIHRFLNTIGGYTRSVQHYSYAAGLTIVPYVLGNMDGLGGNHTPWTSIIANADLVVMFGGVGEKNAQVNSGGLAVHRLREQLHALHARGASVISISPIRDDTTEGAGFRWLPLRPTTDVALMLGLAYTLITERLHDQVFLDRCTVGFGTFRDYVLGAVDGLPKSPAWAEEITQVAADNIVELARQMAAKKTFLMMSWSLQRAEYGEQPYWMLIALACLLGQVGKPGTGFGFGYGAVDNTGLAIRNIKWPSLPQGRNPIATFIPVARISDMLLSPGKELWFNGGTITYPEIKLVYWAGGNPFHHHQDLNRFSRAWRIPEVVISHELQWNALAKFSDVVLPVATQLERSDLVCSGLDNVLLPSHQVVARPAEARTDYEIFAALARQLEVEQEFTDNLDEEGWLRRLYIQAAETLKAHHVEVPDFDAFWGSEGIDAGPADQPPDLLAAFVADPIGNPLPTPSGKIEIFSERIASYSYADCPGHPTWLEPREWLGSKDAGGLLHLISNQPKTKLHSQLDNSPLSRASKVHGREPIRLNPVDAASRGIRDGDIVRVFNSRGACLAGAVLSDAVREGVAQLSTGAWYDPVDPWQSQPLDAHGNPNTVTQDIGTSSLAQGPSAQSCLVQVEPYRGVVPPVRAFDPPRFVDREG